MLEKICPSAIINKLKNSFLKFRVNFGKGYHEKIHEQIPKNPQKKTPHIKQIPLLENPRKNSALYTNSTGKQSRGQQQRRKLQYYRKIW